MKIILLVEDEKKLSDTIRDELVEAGYKVTIVNTGKKCLEFLKLIEPNLIILDIGLPDISGLQILEKLRTMSSHVPVIICAAFDSYQTDNDVLASNVSDYIVKPVDLKDLLLKVKKAIRK